jgi:hypothetical protein
MKTKTIEYHTWMVVAKLMDGTTYCYGHGEGVPKKKAATLFDRVVALSPKGTKVNLVHTVKTETVTTNLEKITKSSITV